MISIGSIIRFFAILGINKTINAFPPIIDNHHVLRIKFTNNVIHVLAPITLHKESFDLYINNPTIIPPSIALKVNPKKYGPVGFII